MDAVPPEKLTREKVTEFTNEDSGEVMRLRNIEVLKKRPPRDMRSAEAFVMAFPDAMEKIAKMGLTPTDFVVLFHLVSIMGFEDHFAYSPTKIAEELGVNRNHVSRSIGELKRRGILIEVRRLRVWINPNYFWRGSLKSRIQVLYDLSKSNGSAVEEKL